MEPNNQVEPKKYSSTSKWFLIIGISIPIIVVISIAILSLAPDNTIKPKYDFLYYFNDSTYSYCTNGEAYNVIDQKVGVSDITSKSTECSSYNTKNDPPKIYRYNVQNNEHYQISLEDVKKLRVDNNSISPDDLSIQRGDYYSSGILDIFGGVNRNYNAISLRDYKNNSKEININISNYYNFKFIGWII